MRSEEVGSQGQDTPMGPCGAVDRSIETARPQVSDATLFDQTALLLHNRIYSHYFMASKSGFG